MRILAAFVNVAFQKAVICSVVIWWAECDMVDAYRAFLFCPENLLYL